MLEKKLVTMACVAGILACGACFLPPLPQHRPPAPPLQLELQGIHRIHVVVENVSGTHRMDADRLASCIVERTEAQGRREHLVAFSEPKAPSQDGELKVTVLSERATPGQIMKKSSTVEWTFEINVSAELRNNAGVTVWSESDGRYLFQRNEMPGVDNTAWADNGLIDGITAAVGNRLVFRMLNDR